MKQSYLTSTLIAVSIFLSVQSANAKNEVSQELKDTAQALIIASGYSCKKIDAVIPQMNGDYKVSCNDYNHLYTIKENGGNYYVKVGY